MTGYSEMERLCLQKLSDILTLERPSSGRRKNDGPAEIVNHLYVGSALDATDRRLLNRLRITHVLNCTSAETVGDYSEVGYSRPDVEHFRSSSLSNGEKSDVACNSGSYYSSSSFSNGTGYTLPVSRNVSSRIGENGNYQSYYQSPHTLRSADSYCGILESSSPYQKSSQSALFGSFSYTNNWLSKPSYETSSVLDFRLPNTKSHARSHSLSNAAYFSSKNGVPSPIADKKEVFLAKVDGKWQEIDVRRGPDGSPYDPARSPVRYYLEIGSDDTVGYPIISRHYQAVRRFVDSARDSGGRALIHCELGINRSTTLALAYLLDTERLGLMQAVRQLRMDRPNVLSNEGFRRQLIRFAADRNLVDVA